MYRVHHVHKNDFNKQHHMLGYAACTLSTKSNGLKYTGGMHCSPRCSVHQENRPEWKALVILRVLRQYEQTNRN